MRKRGKMTKTKRESEIYREINNKPAKLSQKEK
jgi:hypothetical protein